MGCGGAKIKFKPRNFDDGFKKELACIWSEIDISDTQRLVYSMKERLEKVIKAKGGNTRF